MAPPPGEEQLHHLGQLGDHLHPGATSKVREDPMPITGSFSPLEESAG